MGNINLESSALVKKAKRLRKLYRSGKLTEAELDQARAQFKGLFKNVLDQVLSEEPDEE
jgi:hypothetical protein